MWIYMKNPHKMSQILIFVVNSDISNVRKMMNNSWYDYFIEASLFRCD